MVDERRRRDEFGRKREGKINSAGEKEGRESDSLRPSILFVFLAFIESYYCHFSFPPLLSFFAGIVEMEGAEEKNRGGQIGKVDGTRNWRERELENGNRNRRLNGGNEFREGLAKFLETLL